MSFSMFIYKNGPNNLGVGTTTDETEEEVNKGLKEQGAEVMWFMRYEEWNSAVGPAAEMLGRICDISPIFEQGFKKILGDVARAAAVARAAEIAMKIAEKGLLMPRE